MSSQTQFLLNFTGLCEFVPRYRIEDARTLGKNRVKVLLIDTSKALAARYKHARSTHEAHIPVFACPTYNIDTGAEYRQADAKYTYEVNRGGTKEELSIFFLDDQDSWITTANKEALTINYSPGTGKECSKSLDESFAWVAPLAEISPGSQSVKPTCLTKKYMDSYVLSRVELNEGTLKTSLLARDGDTNVVNWEFRVPGRKPLAHRQSLADVVQFETSLKADLFFNTKLIRESNNRRVQELYRKVGGSSQIRVISRNSTSIMAWIKNIPWVDILKTRPLSSGPRKPEVHFAHFYKASANFSGRPNVPHQATPCPFTATQCAFTDLLHQGNPSCPPARAAATDWDSIQ